MEPSKLKNIYIPDWMRILKTVHYNPNIICSKIVTKSKISRKHVSDLLEEHLKMKTIIKTRNGKYTHYKLTDMGVEVTTHVLDIENKLKIIF